MNEPEDIGAAGILKPLVFETKVVMLDRLRYARQVDGKSSSKFESKNPNLRFQITVIYHHNELWFYP